MIFVALKEILQIVLAIRNTYNSAQILEQSFPFLEKRKKKKVVEILMASSLEVQKALSDIGTLKILCLPVY